MAARLSDGSRLTWLNAPSGKEEDRLPVRAAEHNSILSRGEGTEEASQTCTLITTLLDNRAAPSRHRNLVRFLPTPRLQPTVLGAGITARKRPYGASSRPRSPAGRAKEPFLGDLWPCWLAIS